MTLEETIPLMTSNDYKERLKAEYFQLRIRLVEVKHCLDRYPPPLIRLDLMAAQYKAMKLYKKILEARLVENEIDFEEEEIYFEDEEFDFTEE